MSTFRKEVTNCFDVFKENAKEKKNMSKVVGIKEARTNKETQEGTNMKTVKFYVDLENCYFGSDGQSVYIVPSVYIDALNQSALVYIIKGGEVKKEEFNPQFDEGVHGVEFDFPDSFYDKLQNDVNTSEVFNDKNYDVNDRWTGIRRPRTSSDPEVLDLVLRNQIRDNDYSVNAKPTGYYLHYNQGLVLKPYECVEYLGDDNKYYYVALERATGKEEF